MTNVPMSLLNVHEQRLLQARIANTIKMIPTKYDETATRSLVTVPPKPVDGYTPLYPCIKRASVACSYV